MGIRKPKEAKTAETSQDGEVATKKQPEKPDDAWAKRTAFNHTFTLVQLVDIVARYLSNRSFEQTLAEIPQESAWLHRMVPVLQRYRDQEVIVFLGTCPKHDEPEPTNRNLSRNIVGPQNEPCA